MTQQPLDSPQALISDLRAGMAALVAAIEQGQAPLEEISTTLVDMLAKLDSKPPITEVVNAIKALRIESHITVDPTPIRNIVQPAEVRFLPAPDLGATWEVRMPGHYNGPDRVMTIKKIS